MGAAKPIVPFVDEVEREAEEQPEAFGDVIPLMIPMPTYRALSDAAAAQNMTVAQLITEAFNHVLGKEE